MGGSERGRARNLSLRGGELTTLQWPRPQISSGSLAGSTVGSGDRLFYTELPSVLPTLFLALNTYSYSRTSRSSTSTRVELLFQYAYTFTRVVCILYESTMRNAESTLASMHTTLVAITCICMHTICCMHTLVLC